MQKNLELLYTQKHSRIPQVLLLSVLDDKQRT